MPRWSSGSGKWWRNSATPSDLSSSASSGEGPDCLARLPTSEEETSSYRFVNDWSIHGINKEYRRNTNILYSKAEEWIENYQLSNLLKVSLIFIDIFFQIYEKPECGKYNFMLSCFLYLWICTGCRFDGGWHSRWPPWSTNVSMVALPSTSPMTASLFRRFLVVGFCVRRRIWNWLYRGREQWLPVRVPFLCVDQGSGTRCRAHWDRQNCLITVFGRNLKLNCSWKAASVIWAPLRCSSINCAPTGKFTNK